MVDTKVFSAAAKSNDATASMEAGYRGGFRDPKGANVQPMSQTQLNTRFAEAASKDERRVLGNPITQASPAFECPQKSHDLAGCVETSGLIRSLPTNVGDVRPIHINCNSLRNTTPARYSCDTLCGNWSEERRDPHCAKVSDDAVLRASASSHVYMSESVEASLGVEANRLPTDPVVEDEGERLQTSTGLAFTNPYTTERNEKTADIRDVFPESEALRAYRAKWTARPFAKETEHSTTYKNWGQVDSETIAEKYK